MIIPWQQGRVGWINMTCQTHFLIKCLCDSTLHSCNNHLSSIKLVSHLDFSTENILIIYQQSNIISPGLLELSVWAPHTSQCVVWSIISLIWFDIQNIINISPTSVGVFLRGKSVWGSAFQDVLYHFEALKNNLNLLVDWVKENSSPSSK